MQLFEEKDIKAFKRMKNINKTNLVNRVEIELKKVINQLINNEKDKKKKENEIKYLKKINIYLLKILIILRKK